MGLLCPIFVVACVRGHLIVIVCVINNTDGSSLLGDFLLLLLCSEELKNIGKYRQIGYRNRQIIGIGKCEKMHIGATLITSVLCLFLSLDHKMD